MTDLLPILPLQTVIFPGMRAPLTIFEGRYRQMLADFPSLETAFGVVLLKAGRDTDPLTRQRPYSVGTGVRILSRRTRPDGALNLTIEGQQRFATHHLQAVNGYGLATVKWMPEETGDAAGFMHGLESTVAAYRRFVEAVTTATAHPFPGVRIDDDPRVAAWDIASRLPMTNRERQRLLELDGQFQRFSMLSHVIRRETRLIEVLGLVGVPLDYAGGKISIN